MMHPEIIRHRGFGEFGGFGELGHAARVVIAMTVAAPPRHPGRKCIELCRTLVRLHTRAGK